MVFYEGSMTKPKLLIGTSGWSYKHWRRKFYPENLPESEWLRYYCQTFSTAEINNSFYKLPSVETYENWKQQSASNFTFAVKGSRFLTHMKKLKDATEPWDNIVSHSAGLGSKRGPILLQFPEKWKKNLARLQEFFEITKENQNVDIALEFRNETWFASDTFKLLEKYGVALCIADSQRFIRQDVITGPFTYFRYHGRGARIYAGSYSKEVLKKEAKKMTKLLSQKTSVYAYFNNDGNANAVRNAKTLEQLCLESGT